MDYSAKVLSEVISEQTHVISNNKGRKMRVAILQIEDRVDPYFEWCFNNRFMCYIFTYFWVYKIPSIN